MLVITVYWWKNGKKERNKPVETIKINQTKRKKEKKKKKVKSLRYNKYLCSFLTERWPKPNFFKLIKIIIINGYTLDEYAYFIFIIVTMFQALYPPTFFRCKTATDKV